MKLLRFEQSDFFQIVRLVSKADQIKLFIVSLFQIFLSFLDLIGVAFFGLIGSVSVAAISSDELSGRTNEIINFIGLSNYSSQSQVVFLGLYAASLMSVKTYAALYFNKKIIFFMSVKSAKLSTNLTSSLFKKSFTDLKKQGSQKLIYTLTTGVDRMIVGVLATSVSLIADFSLLIILVIGLIIISPILTITLLILLGLVSFALYFYIRNKNKRLGKLKAIHTIESASKIHEAISNYRELFLRGQRQVFADNIGKVRQLQVSATANSNYLINLNKYILEASVLLITLMITGIQFFLSSALRSVATLTLFFAAISRIAPAVFRIQQNLLYIKGSLGESKSTLDLIESLRLSTSNPISEKFISTVPVNHNEFIGKISIKNLQFKYPGSEKIVVSNVNLELSAGMYVAIVGPSGAGKSTFIDLMLGLHHPCSGKVEISGLEVIHAIEKWPGAIAYVPQEIQLISGTVTENVLLGFKDEESNNKLVLNALKKAQLEEFIESNGSVLDFNIGEEGGKLSGGQRQRIGIARALLTSPKILVMDEATSALDAQTEVNISNTISQLKQDSLVIVVAHRLATVKRADLIIYMEDGKIKAQGSFDQVRTLVPNFDTQAQLMGL